MANPTYQSDAFQFGAFESAPQSTIEIAADFGAYDLTGFDGPNLVNLLLNGATEAYNLTGQPADWYSVRHIEAVAGAYNLTGSPMTLVVGFIPEAGVYTFDGKMANQDAGFYPYVGAYSGANYAEQGYVTTGYFERSPDARIHIGRIVSANPNPYIVVGSESSLYKGYDYPPITEVRLGVEYGPGNARMVGTLIPAQSPSIPDIIAALFATAIPVNVKLVNDIVVKGVGTNSDPWNPV